LNDSQVPFAEVANQCDVFAGQLEEEAEGSEARWPNVVDGRIIEPTCGDFAAEVAKMAGG
jgi:hypothetical protein